MRGSSEYVDHRSGRTLALVVGGSLGGLAAALALRESRCEVEVFERSCGELRGRGAGIVVQPELLHFLEECGISTRGTIGILSKVRQYLDRNGGVARTGSSHQLMTSWGTVYRQLRAAFPRSVTTRGADW